MSRFMSMMLLVLSLVLALAHLTPGTQADSADVTTMSRSPSSNKSKYSPWGREQHCGSHCDAYGSFDDKGCSDVVNGKSSSSSGLIGFSAPMTLNRRSGKTRELSQLAVHLARDVKRGSSTQGKMQLGLYQQEQRNKKNLNSWKLVAQTEWQSLSKRSSDKYAFYDIDSDCEVELSTKYNYRVALGIAPKSSVNVYASDDNSAFDKYDFNSKHSGGKRNSLPSRHTISSSCTASLSMEMIVCANSTSSK